MEYRMALHTDIGIEKETNQDSCCVKEAETKKGRIAFALLCDGMGGLAKGEVASATLIRTFSDWFEKELPLLLAQENPMEEIRYRWDRMIKEQNQNIAAYGRHLRLQLGSTITALLILEDGRYLIGHVGDSRAYRFAGEQIEILTEDQTVVAMEVRQGRLAPEAAEADPRRNVLLQCVGASRIVEPAFYEGQAQAGECYMLCSDGFRHVISETEMKEALSPDKNNEESEMKEQLVKLVELNKTRQETDNITALLIKTI